MAAFQLILKHKGISQHLAILFKRLCVSIKSLFYEPEQKVSARRSLYINEGYESIFFAFSKTSCAWALAQLEGAQNPTASNP